MKLSSMKVSNFRNLNNFHLSFSDDINYIVGENNIGKSNLLYAINRVIIGKSFEESDFNEPSSSIEIILRLLLDDIEKGLFDDLFDPLNPNYINIRIVQESADENLQYYHLETSEKISVTLIRRILVVNYDSLRNPKNELDFKKTKGAATFLNYIIKDFINRQDDHISYLNKKAIKNLEKYISDILTKLVIFDRFGVKPIVEKNDFELLTRILVLKDSNKIDISDIGYGVQFNILIILSILERIINYVKKIKENDEKNIQALLIFDEPEIHLHPYLQKTLIKDILKIATGEDLKFVQILKDLFGIDSFSGQVIIATHSPSILSDDYTKIIRMYSDCNEAKVINANEISLNPSEKKQLLMQFEYIKDAVFARGVLIVEGESEYGSFKLFGNTLGIDFDREGIALIKAGGADSIPPLIKLFDKLGIKSIGIMDKDKQIEKKIPKSDNLIFTSKLTFDSEIVYYLIKKEKYDILETILKDYDSMGIDRTIEMKALNKTIKKHNIKNIVISKNYKFSDVNKDDDLYPVMYITWFSINKGIILGKIIGLELDKETIPTCYSIAIKKIKGCMPK